MAARLQWNQVKPDFSNSAASMRNAMAGISEAGTVFDRIRDDIAAEEQRAAEAAYKQQVFDENIRQFEEQQLWNREKAIADREHDIKLENLRSQNALALQDARLKYEERDKIAANKLYAATLGVLNTSLAQGKSLLEASKDAETFFIQNSNGKFVLDPKRIYNTDQATELAKSRDPEFRAKRRIDNETSTVALFNERNALKGDAAEALSIQEAAFYDPVSNSMMINDTKTGTARPLTERENILLSAVTTADREAKIGALNTAITNSGLTDEHLKGLSSRMLDATGKWNRAQEIAVEENADISKLGLGVLEGQAKEEIATRSADAELKRKLEREAKLKRTPSAFDDKLIAFTGKQFKAAGKDGKSTIIELPKAADAFANQVKDTLLELGADTDDYQIVLNALEQDVVAGRFDPIGFNPKNIDGNTDFTAVRALNRIKARINKERGTSSGNGTGTGTGKINSGATVGKPTASTTSESAGLANTVISDNVDKDALKSFQKILEHRQKRLKSFTNVSGRMNDMARIQLPHPEQDYSKMQTDVADLEQVIKALTNNQSITWNNESTDLVYKDLLELRRTVARNDLKKDRKERLARLDAMLKLFKKDN